MSALSKTVAFWLLIISTIYLLSCCEGAVIRSKLEEPVEYSPYFKALSSVDRTRIAEYERLKRSLMHYKPIDWDIVVRPRITDDDDSSS